eukprot:scaffold13276_cov35-Tisochrysis_lutea.AAC.1
MMKWARSRNVLLAHRDRNEVDGFLRYICATIDGSTAKQKHCIKLTPHTWLWTHYFHAANVLHPRSPGPSPPAISIRRLPQCPCTTRLRGCGVKGLDMVQCRWPAPPFGDLFPPSSSYAYWAGGGLSPELSCKQARDLPTSYFSRWEELSLLTPTALPSATC